ncbi:MAG: fibronectin type III domain-containing protein [Bacteroidota bacterium]
MRAGNGCDTSLYSNTINVSTSAPIAPTAVAASNFTCTSMNANWGAASGATAYYLEVATSASFGLGTFVTGYNNVNVNNVTTYNITGLTSSTTYYYRVRAGNGCDTSLYSNTIISSTAAPVAPAATAPSNYTCTSVNANWGAVTGATAYYLEVSTSASFGIGTFVPGYNNINVNNATTYNITGLSSSAIYYYRLRAGNGCDTSLYSNTVLVSTSAPVAPNAVAASNFTCTSVNANWGAVSGATTYYLEVASSASFGVGTFVTGYNNINVSNVTTYNVTGLTSSSTYYYRVRAGNGCDTSTYSNTISLSTSAPVAPNAVTASNFTCTSLNANWGAVAGATSYFLEVATNASFGVGTFVTGYNNINVNNITTYNVVGLTSSTTYYYRVRAGNGCDTSLYSNTISVSTSAPVAPTATGASNFTCTSMNANWGAVAGATAYYLQVASNPAFGTGTFVAGYNNVNVNNVTTYNITGLISNTTYYYRVRAGNGCDTSSYSNTITVTTTAPIAPTATAASNLTCTSMNANWGTVPSATAYYLQVSTSASFGAGTFVAGFNNVNVNNVTTKNVTGLTINTTYYYRVRAGNGCDTSSFSNTILVTTTAPIAPNALAASNLTCVSLNANWGAVAGTTAYFLDVSTSAAFGAGTFVAGFNNLNVGGAVTKNVTGLTPSTTYYYRVRASNGCATSSNSNTISIISTAPIAPAAIAATNFTCTSMNANWGTVPSATAYYLQVSTSASFLPGTFVAGFSNLNVNNVITKNVTGLTSNTSYYYRVRAGNGCDTSSFSNTIAVITTAPNAPGALAASNFTCTSMNANWAAAPAATAYYLEVSTTATFSTFLPGFNNVNVGTALTKNITGLLANTTYFYRVRAGNGCDTSSYSNTVAVSTSAPLAPVAVAANNFTCTSMNANWGAVAGATVYFLEVSTSPSFGTFIAGFNNLNVNNVTTKNITGLTVNTTYYYRVRAGNGCDTSLYSNTISVATSAPLAPTAVAASNFTCTSLNVNWSASAGAIAYFLDVSTDPAFGVGTFVGTYNNLNVNNTTTYNITGLTVNVTYYYRVRASNGCSTGLNSNTITTSTTAPIAPTATAASNFTCTSLNANWGAVSGATAYIIDVATDAGFTALLPGYSSLNVGNNTTINVTGLVANTTYYYRVRALNGCSTSLNSSTISVSTTAPISPTALAASNFTCTSLNANWGAVSGATIYFLDVATDAGFTSFVAGYTNVNVNNVTTYNITGLAVNTTYFYRVRAANGCSVSLNSNSVMVITSAPFAPVGVAASNFTCTTMNANWGAAAGANAYFLDVSIDPAFGSFVGTYNNLNVNNTTTYNLTGLTTGTTYYYRVRAANGCSVSQNSNTINATITAPNAPSALAPSNVVCLSMNANWGASAGAITYFLDVATDASFGAGTFVAGYNNLNVNNVLTYNVTGLSAGVTYYYRVRAANGCNASLNSNFIVVQTSAITAPVASAATSVACTTFNANWGAVSGVISYFLDVSTSPSFAAGLFVGAYNNLNVNNVTTYSITGLALNTTYYYRVRAMSGCTTSPNSNSITASTDAPAAPVATAASNVTCTSMNANWSAVSGAISYYLDVSSDASFGAGTFIGAFNNFNVGNVTTYNITGLTGTTVYYRVRAASGCASGPNSNFITVNPSAITAPVAVAASGIACTVFNANWAASSGAIGYFLDVSTSPSFAAGSFVGAFNNFSVGNVTTYNVTGLTVNTNYYYRVRSINACVTSPNSNSITASTNAPAAPVATAATNVTCTSMNTNWSAVSGAITYFLDVSTDASFGAGTFIGAYNNFNAGNVTTYNVTGLTGTTVYYRVRAASGCASGTNSNFVMVNPSAITAPVASAATGVACTVFNANWGAVTGAINYFLDVSTSPSFAAGAFVGIYNDLNVGLVQSYNVSGLTVNTNYYYRVRAVNACVTSPNSNSITASTNAPAAPNALEETNITCTSMNCNWTAVSGAITYFLDIAPDPAFLSFFPGYNNLNVGNVTTYNAGSLPGSVRYYRVRAASGCASGGNSNFIVADPSILNAPNATAASSITCTFLNANWQAVAGVIAYEIDVSTDPAFGSFIAGFNALNVGNVLTKNVTGLTINTTYYYRVRGLNACVMSLNSNTITASTFPPAAPVANGATNLTCAGMNANWAAASGAINYLLDVSMDPAFGSFFGSYNALNVGNTTTYNITGLVASTIYYYRLRAVNGCSAGGYSNIITAATTPPAQPTANAVTSFTCTSFLASWAAVGGATSYALDVSNDPAFGTFIAGYNNLNVGNVLNRNVTGLAANVTYYYRVRTVNNCGTSTSSNSIAYTITAPTVPSPGTTGISCTSFGTCWSLSAGATNYFIDVSTNASFSTFVAGYNNLSMGNVSCRTVSGLATGFNYYYRIRSANACGSSGNSGNLTVPLDVPGNPTVTNTTISNITCTSFEAVWTGTLGATSYFLDVSTSPAFGAGTFVGVFNNFNAGSLTSFDVTALTPGTTYYYRVRGGNGCGQSLSSNTITVSTVVPNAPTATAASSLATTTFIANWTSSANATTYYVDVATDALFANYVTGYNNLNVGNVLARTITGLTTGTTYYYRVRASNGCSTSPNSGNISLITP